MTPEPYRQLPRPGSGRPFLALAPMDGVTDWIYRDVITSLPEGADHISLCVSEFIRVTDRPPPARSMLRECPELRRGGRTRGGVPVMVQLLGGRAEPMAAAAAQLCELGAPGIDLNFGCPAKTVNRHDGGAALLKDPSRIEAVTGAVRRLVPASIPVSVKVRTGWADTRGMADIARAAEQGGAAWLTVHGRTRADMYGPPANWQAIQVARDGLSIPVVANGDIVDEASLRACRRDSGCESVMIGRGAMGDPYLFARLRGQPAPAADADGLRPWLLRYAQAILEAGLSERHVLNRLKQWLGLGSRANPALRPLFDAVKRLDSWSAARAALGATHC